MSAYTVAVSYRLQSSNIAITTNVKSNSALTKFGDSAELSVLVCKLQNPGVSIPQRDHRLFDKVLRVLPEELKTVLLSTLIQHPLLSL